MIDEEVDGERPDRSHDHWLDPFDPQPPAWATVRAEDITRQIFEFVPRGTGGQMRRRSTSSPVLRFTDSYVVGVVDLRAVEFPYLLEFVRCRFEEAPDLRETSFLSLLFRECWLSGLSARNLQCRTDMSFEGRTRVVGAAIDLTSASIGGSLFLRKATLRNENGPVLFAPRVEIGGALFGEDLRVTGAVELPAARIQETLNLSGARLTVGHGVALAAERVQIGGTVELAEDFSSNGAVVLSDATVTSSVLLTRPTFGLADSDGPRGGGSDNYALALDGVKVGGGLVLAGTSVNGALNLAGSVVAGDTDLRGCRLDGRGGSALIFESAQVGRDLLGSSDLRPLDVRGSVDGRRAVIGRQLTFDGAKLTAAAGDKGISLNLFDIRTQNLVLTLGRQVDNRVDLRKAQCVSLTDNAELWTSPAGIRLDEFSYESLGVPVAPGDRQRVKDRLAWLRNALAGSYQPSPYDQLITVLRTSGTDSLAVRVQIEKQRLRYGAIANNYRLLGPLIRLASFVLRVGFGYGYRISLALCWLVFLWLLGSAWFALHPALAPINPQDQVPWNPTLYTLDLLVPLVDLGNKNRWLVSGASQTIVALLTIMGWILATTIAAELARVLRRPA